jgi:lipid-A-disaccharide synthase
MEKTYKIYMIAGEASGDHIGALFMQEFSNYKNAEYYGIGGNKMMENGIKLSFHYQEISMMGFFEIIPHLFSLLRKINSTAKEISKLKPDLVLTIDSPGFCFRVISKIQKLRNKNHTKFIHYVAPTVWAYKEQRAKLVAKLYDHLFVLLPFEKEFFTQVNLDTTFVGHPLTQHVIGTGIKFRKDHKLTEQDFLICVSAGSRKSEIKRLLPIFISAINLLLKTNHNIIIVIPTFHHLRPFVEEAISSLATNQVIITDDQQDKKNAIAACNLALSKCGTITSEFALNKVPTIAAYKINSLSAFFLKRMLKISYFSIINILAKKSIIPEFIQEACTPQNLYQAMKTLIDDKEQALKQVEESYEIINLLKNDEHSSPAKIATMKTIEILENTKV